MANIVRRDPWSILNDMQNDFLPLFSDFGISRRWQPAVDVREDDNSYILEAELPGMTDKDIEVTVENGMLRISSEKTEEHEEKDKRFIRRERSYRSFSRSFRLPEDTDHSSVQAALRNGLLTVTVPKAEPEKKAGKKISIKSG
jgi:HSP20 family protein